MKKTKILIFINSLTCGGAERVASSLAGYLARSGCAVIVVTMHGKERDFYRLDESVTRYCLDTAHDKSFLGKILVNISNFRRLRQILSHDKPDVVLGMMTKCAVMSILTGLGLPVRVVVSERSYPGKKKIAWLLAQQRWLLYCQATALAAQTSEEAIWLKRHVAAANIKVIPNAIFWPLPEREPVILPQDWLASGDKVMLAAGRLSQVKGFDLLIKAYSMIGPHRSAWKLVIVGKDGDAGDTGTRDHLVKLVRNLGLEGRVFLPGLAGNIGDWYERADIFVLSSRYEGFPNVLLEAMACGCPCIAFDCETGPRDIIKNSENGLLVPAEDVPALARAMEQLMLDQDYRKELGSRAVAVRETFSEETVMGKWKSLFLDLTRKP
ncbi:glycosyltransferase family 4 protein [Desulfonatronum parangueonense]